MENDIFQACNAITLHTMQMLNLMMRRDGVAFLIGQAYILMDGTAQVQGWKTALLPVLDEPLAGLTLKLLKRHGVSRVTILSAGRDAEDALGTGEDYGVQLTCQPDWTGEAHGDAYVLPGHVLTDADLTLLAGRREDAGADAALWREIAVVSAGVLQAIPAGTPAECVMKQIKALSRSMMEVPLQGYYGRVIDADSYHQVQAALLAGQVGLPVSGHRYGRAIIARNGAMPWNVRVAGLCYVGRAARIGAGSVLGAGTVVGHGACIGAKTRLENACIMPGAQVEGEAVLRNVLVFPHGAMQRTEAEANRFSGCRT